MASKSWRSNWVSKKCEIASALARGEAGGSYSEAAILICTVLSALSAEVWPGRGIDRTRFIELLVRFGSSPRVTMTVSVPLLVRHLNTSSSIELKDCAALLVNKFLPFGPSRVVTGSDVDKMESELVSICPVLTPKTTRRFSYASLLYEQIRSSYAHEYQAGEEADSWPMTMCEGQSVSYVNRLHAVGTPESERLIHFHIEWLMKLAVDLASSIDATCATVPEQIPSGWWIHGAS